MLDVYEEVGSRSQEDEGKQGEEDDQGENIRGEGNGEGEDEENMVEVTEVFGHVCCGSLQSIVLN